MKIKSILMLVIAAMLMALTGCTGGSESTDTDKKTAYVSITAAEAKKIMDEQSGYVVLDVRTQEEYDEGHIENAVLIPDYEIGKRAETELDDKNQLILVYCRSGRRSKNASAELAALGYTNVKEFGGIIDWEYAIVK